MLKLRQPQWRRQLEEADSQKERDSQERPVRAVISAFAGPFEFRGAPRAILAEGSGALARRILVQRVKRREVGLVLKERMIMTCRTFGINNTPETCWTRWLCASEARVRGRDCQPRLPSDCLVMDAGMRESRCRGCSVCR